MFALILLAGCASSEVSDYRPYQGKLVKPDRILVYNFAASPADLPPGLKLSGPGFGSTQPTAEQHALGRQLGAAIASDLVTEMQNMRLPAVRAAGQPPLKVNDIALIGYFTTVDAGSAAKRVGLGFGSGGAELQTVVNGFVMTAQGMSPLGSGTVDAGSGKTPGAAAPLVVAVATGNPLGLVVSSATKGYGEVSGSETIEGAAERTAQDIAAKIKITAEKQGWI
ncbi:DUF4410 domain-containing protein [Defluviicoccus vanus]|uniref:DUF4410 domain-containing protein n=1 Tax=Defluviicoccus vanus TaxID=111831 RepID=A0A7H1N204_9PROT|nr:DUF4410 domain-containing protein [Defluviicoccus vanus]QNT69740.1 DUF4410 domain-containing protein [Defluviicoccus vanus]